jgi:hypothetical protein
MASREEIKERIEIMQAWLDGEIIERIRKNKENAEWGVMKQHEIGFRFERYRYRIKSQPMEIWYDPSDDNFHSLAKDGLRASSKRIKFREVLEDE